MISSDVHSSPESKEKAFIEIETYRRKDCSQDFLHVVSTVRGMDKGNGFLNHVIT